MVTFDEKMNLQDKIALRLGIIEKVKQEIAVLQNDLQQLKVGLESKSSAGDKHNTEQAMQHIEEEKKLQQLQLWLNHAQILQRILDTACENIKIGALVHTNLGWFYCSIPLGYFEFNNEKIMILSPQSPLAKAFNQKKNGDTVLFNHNKYEILEVI